MSLQRVRLDHWIRAEVARLVPGSQLPSDARISEQHSVSVSTVKRVLSQLALEGLVERVSGRGTFVGHAPDASRAVQVENRSAAERMADELYRLLCKGKWKTGETLPSVKFCSLQFKTTPSTVISAYRRLVAKGLVTKLGKQYLVGGVDEQFTAKPRREVVFFAVEQDLEEIYSRSEFSHAYVRMEHELLRSGYVLSYESFKRLPELTARWARTGLSAHGIVVVTPNNAETPSLIAAYRDLVGRMPDRSFPAVIVGGNIDQKPPLGCHVISHGNTQTGLARTLANYLCRKGSDPVALYVDAENDGPVWVVRFLKLVAEIRNMDRTHPTTIVTASAGPPTLESFTGWLYNKYSPQRVAGVFDKYSSDSVDEFFRSSLHLVSNLGEALDRISGAVTWVFPRDKEAAAALDYLHAAHRRVPNDVAVIGLENDPSCFHRGISTCVRDFQAMGYLMAHAIIGDFPIERSGKGYMRVPSLMLERRTTR